MPACCVDSTTNPVTTYSTPPQAVTELLKLAPSTAVLLTRDEGGRTLAEQEVPLALVQRADLLKVVSGARVPVDGEVVEGRSYVDESMVTGEAKLVHKRAGDAVISGTVNSSGPLVIRATRVGGDTTLAAIVRLVERAQMSKAPIQAIADRISAVFVPAILVAALLTWLGWFVAGGSFTCMCYPGPCLNRHLMTCPCGPYRPDRAPAGRLDPCGKQPLPVRAALRHLRRCSGLPLRAGPGHAHGRHGGHRRGRQERHPHQGMSAGLPSAAPTHFYQYPVLPQPRQRGSSKGRSRASRRLI